MIQGKDGAASEEVSTGHYKRPGRQPKHQKATERDAHVGATGVLKLAQTYCRRLDAVGRQEVVQ